MEIEVDPKPDSRPVLEAGAMLGSYRIESLIGRGGMGEVYLARDERLHRPVAIKRIRFDRALDGHQQERFHREALAVAQLSHPAIVQVYEWLDTPFGNCLVMEWIQGHNLAKVIAAGGLDLRRILQLACQIADGLTEAHGKGFLHRDLKPENVLMTSSGHAKIVDFGLAVPLERFADDAETALTKSGAVVGTVYTMSPEQARGRKLDLRSDLFSFGCILYELVAGRSPFRANTWFDTVHNIVTAEPAPLRPDLPPDLVELVFRLLAKDPAHRPASAAEVHRILEACLLGPGTPAIHDSLSSPLKNDASASLSAATVHQALPVKANAASIAVEASEVSPTPVPDTAATKSGSRRRLSEKGLIATLGILLLLSLATAKPSIWKKETELAKKRHPQILVLPFQDETGENRKGLATGATDEMARRLSRIEGLGVMAGLAAEPYSQKKFSALKEELSGRIDYVLTGKIYRSGSAGGAGTLQVSAQLARLQDGSQVWSSSFFTNPDVDPIMAKAGRSISREIGTRLGLSSPLVKAEIAYQSAIEYRRKPGYISKNLIRAVELSQLAVQADPEMAVAWAELAISQSILYSKRDSWRDWAAGAISALDVATRLEPQAPEVRLAAAFVQLHVHHRFQYAKTLFEDFIADHPSDADGLIGLGYAERRLGLLAQACSHFELASQLKPSVELSLALAETYRARRRWKDAHHYYQGAANFNPKAVSVHAALALNLFDWHGSVRDAHAGLANFSLDRSPDLLNYWLKLDLYAGDYAKAFDRHSYWPRSSEFDQAENTWMAVRAADLLGRKDRARLLAVANRDYLLKRVATDLGDAGDKAYLALAQAYLGEPDQARRAMTVAIESTPKDEFMSPRLLEFEAEMEILLGNDEAAMTLLRGLLKKEYQHPISVARLRFDPAWAPLRSNPEFAGWVELH